MKKCVCAIVVVLITLVHSHAQDSLHTRYQRADSLFKTGHYEEAYRLFKLLKPEVPINDTLFEYIVWYYASTASLLENELRMKEKFSEALPLAEESLKLIRENKIYFDEEFANREAWMLKNLLVSSFALGKKEEAAACRAELYRGYREKTLPKGIDTYYNYDFFRVGDKNIWGYEWFEELPDDRMSRSFTKIVYYVYSTNPDGSDKDQLYRLHVLMFHKISPDAPDYILEKQMNKDDRLISGSYYSYMYRKEVDYEKLKADVKKIVSEDIQPDSRRVTPAN